MKLPNGYGSIINLGKNRRKPFGVRITVGRKDNGNQIYKYLGYYETREDAIYALAIYNKGGVSLESNKVTFAEVFEMWSKKAAPKMKEKSYKRYLASYNVMPDNLKNKKMMELRAVHFQDYIDTNGKSKNTNAFFKSMVHVIYSYAMEIELVQKDQSTFLKVEGKESKKKKVFTDKEIETLWKLENNLVAEVLIVLQHTGMRISELLELTKESVFIDHQYAIGGLKTDAGIDRIIPFCDKIMPIIESWYGNHNKYLIEYRGKQFKYTTFINKFNSLMEELKMVHTIHETRHTFISKMDTLGINKATIKKIAGHSGGDITEKVYTHKDVEELLEAVNNL